jgi:predicted ATP-grasp superfamily ATP-dependent carboligase
MKAVVTGGQFPAALAAARSLHREGIRTVTVSSNRASYVRFSRASAEHHRAPDVSESASRFVHAVAAACAPEEPTVVVPGTEPELFALVHWRDLLPPWVLGLPTPDVLDAVTDKARLNELARSAGIAIPETTILAPDDPAHEVRFPAVVKPVRTAYVLEDTVVSASPVCVDDAGGLTAARRRHGHAPVLIQPLLSSDLVGLAGVMHAGTLLAPVQQVALSLFPWPCGGSAVARTTPIDDPLLAGVTQLLAATGWEGVVQVQWLATDEGPLLIDVNPRIYGSLALANAAGSPLVAIWAKLLLGLDWEADEPAEVLYRNFETFVRAHRTAAGRRLPRTATRTASSVIDRTDPLPVLASLARGARKARKDAASLVGRGSPAARQPDRPMLGVDDDDVPDAVPGVGAGSSDDSAVDSGDDMLAVRARR